MASRGVQNTRGSAVESPCGAVLTRPNRISDRTQCVVCRVAALQDGPAAGAGARRQACAREPCLTQPVAACPHTLCRRSCSRSSWTRTTAGSAPSARSTCRCVVSSAAVYNTSRLSSLSITLEVVGAASQVQAGCAGGGPVPCDSILRQRARPTHSWPGRPRRRPVSLISSTAMPADHPFVLRLFQPQLEMKAFLADVYGLNIAVHAALCSRTCRCCPLSTPRPTRSWTCGACPTCWSSTSSASPTRGEQPCGALLHFVHPVVGSQATRGFSALDAAAVLAPRVRLA